MVEHQQIIMEVSTAVINDTLAFLSITAETALAWLRNLPANAGNCFHDLVTYGKSLIHYALVTYTGCVAPMRIYYHDWGFTKTFPYISTGIMLPTWPQYYDHYPSGCELILKYLKTVPQHDLGSWRWAMTQYVTNVILVIFIVMTTLIFLTRKLFALVLDMAAHWHGLSKEFFVQERISELLQQDVYNTAHLRDAFNNNPWVPARETIGHTHGAAAANRSTGTSFIESFAKLAGLNPYFFQMSRSDQRRGRVGSRTSFWAKDVNAQFVPFNPREDDLHAMVDVDQYIDMPAFLCTQFKPTILYTFVPCAAARTTKNYAYTFTDQNEVEYKVTGGATYKHQVWDYGQDNTITVKKIFGIPYACAVYLIDRRQTDDDHMIILFSPMVKWTGIKAMFAAFFLSGKTLSRLEPVTDNSNFARLYLFSEKEHLVSTAECGHYTAATVPVDKDEAIKLTQRLSSSDIQIPSVLSILGNTDRSCATILTAYHRLRLERHPPTIYPLDVTINHYRPLNTVPEITKTAMTAFMQPIIPDTYVPQKCYSNDVLMVTERITKLSGPNPPLHPIMQLFIGEFLEEMFPQRGILHPTELEEVFIRQDRPTQRHILQATMFDDPLAPTTYKTFMKAEAYSEPKDPRVITTLPGALKREYSQYMYALSDYVVENCDWYAFGHNPINIAAKVAAICSRATENVGLGDYSRFDGRVNGLIRLLEAQLLCRAFSREDSAIALELHRSQSMVKCVTSNGYKYMTGEERKSGSPETAIFNSIVNKFLDYVGRRRTQVDGAFISSSVAYNAPGIFGGDDSLTADVTPATMVKAAAEWGMALEMPIVKRGEPGVNFLARYYTRDVWNGDVHSTCDLVRQLPKFHITVKLDIDPVSKFIEKCRAFYLTDAKTPIIGELVCKCHILFTDYANRYGLKHRFTDVTSVSQTLRLWGSGYLDNNYPSVDDQDALDRLVCAYPEFDYESYVAHIRNANKLEDLLTIPCCCPEQPMKIGKFPYETQNTVVLAEKNVAASKTQGNKGKDKPKRSTKPDNGGRPEKPPNENKPPNGKLTRATMARPRSIFGDGDARKGKPTT